MYRHKVEICGVDTSKLPVLKNEEMKKLFIRLQQQGGVSARGEFIDGKLRRVLRDIERINKRGEYGDDVFQVGWIGVMKSIDKFDLSKKVSYATYAVAMIIAEIRKY